MTDITRSTRPSAVQLHDAEPYENPIVAATKYATALKEQSQKDREARETAEKEADYLRGQSDLLLLQHQASRHENKMLRGELDEIKVHVTAIGAQIASLIEKIGQGGYRQPGSRETPQISDQMESDLADLTATLGRKHGANNPREET